MVAIISQNVNGLRNNVKRRGIFMHLKQKAEIICLQETHSEHDDEKYWTQEFRGSCFYSHGETNARGVSILVKEGTKVEIKKVLSDQTGRALCMQFEYKGELFVVINIYAPNIDTPNFFINIFKYFEELEGKRILVGDFNFAMNVDIDRTGVSTSNNNRSAEVVKQYMEDTFLTDVWRDRNPEAKKFTFCRLNPTFTGSRIDYVLTDVSLNSWTEEVKIVPGYKTDHSAIFLKLDPIEQKRGRGFWRMNQQILFEMEYLNIIAESVKRTKELSKNNTNKERWEAIKLNIIGESQRYSNERAANRKLIISQLENKIEQYERKRDEEKLSEAESKLYLRTKEDMNVFIEEKAQGAIFRSGQAYYSLGEKSTKYFFGLEKAKSAAKGMNAMLHGNEVIKDPDIILRKIHDFYKNLYTSDPNVEFKYENTSEIRVSNEHKEMLEGEITMAELQLAISQMKRGKAPGCDGIITEFYVMNFNLIKEPLLQAINEGYKDGKLHDSALRGVISLIPKKNSDTRKISALRPISLLNTDYKLVEKCLAYRLKPVLNELINEDQKGFLAGRNISCNIRRVLDMIEYVDEENDDGLIIQIDFMKCFDMVEIDSLIASMHFFGIGKSFIHWTKTIYNQPQSCVMNNGRFTQWFPVTRSVKQGGPCSAYFFLLLAEVLAIQLRSDPSIKGFMINEIQKLFGQFADDIDLYLKADPHTLNRTMRIFTEFGKQSGFKINYEKTTVYRIGSIKKSNARIYTRQELSWTNKPIDVLGVMVSTDKSELCKINYEALIKKAEITMKRWSIRNLSLTGKVLIVNSLVASLFVYKMSVLPRIPKETVNRIHKSIEQFIWNNKRPKIQLKTLQSNKKEGGLGLVNLETKDNALKTKWIKIINTDSLILEFATRKLSSILKNDIWKCNLTEQDIVLLFEDSFWRDVLIAWSKLNFTKVKDCQGINEISNQFIWYNSLITSNYKPLLFTKIYKNGLESLGQLCNIEGGLLPREDACKMFEISAMQYNIIISAIPKQWKNKMKTQKITENIENKAEIFSKRANTTAHYYEHVNSNNEAIESALTKWKSRYNTDIKRDEFIILFKALYKVTNNAKLRSFQYRLLHSAVVTKQHLYRWKITSNNLCFFCEEEKETINHLLVHCKYVQPIWDCVREICNQISKTEIIVISEKAIMENLINPRLEHVFNFICLVTKQFIYSNKCTQTKLTKQGLIQRIEKYKRYELYQAKRENTLRKHCKKWLIVDTNTNYNGSGLDNSLIYEYIYETNI